MKLYILTCLFLLLSCQSIPLTPYDLNSLRQIGSFDLSSQNKVVYSVKVNDLQERKSLNSLYFIDNESTFNHRKLTEPKLGRHDHSPLFSHDGEHIFFLSNRNGSSQIYVIHKDGDESSVRQLTNFPISITSFKVYKNYIMFSAEVYIDCNDFECTSDRDKAQNPIAGKVYDALFVRHWDQWKTPKKVNHVFIQRIVKKNNQYELTGKPIDLLFGMNADSPVPPFGGSECYDLSPNESLAVFTASLVTHNTSWDTGWKTYTIPIYNSNVGTPMSITDYTQARTQNPVFSRSGKYIAYLAMDRPGHEADKLSIVVYDVNQGKTFKLNNDYSFSSIIWGNDDNTIFGDLDLKGTHSLAVVRFDLNGNSKFTTLIGNGTVSLPAISSSNKVVYAKSSFVSPKDLFTFQWIDENTIQTRKLTDENPSVTEKYNLKNPDPIIFHSTIDSERVEGFLLKPLDFTPSKKYPLVLLIHGGPEQAWNNGWSYGWNPQIYAAEGFGVAQINIRGSTGYGQNFTDGIRGEWGGLAFNDLMDGINHILRENPWIDQDKLAACGGSFGGYMVNWIAGNTDRFKVLVNHDGIFDTSSLYYTTEELWFPEWEFYGPHWERVEEYEKYNPKNHISKWKTPMLVIQGNRDYRIANAQSIGTFSALQRKGIKSKLLFFPEENHWVLDPSNSVQWYTEVLNFIKENIN